MDNDAIDETKLEMLDTMLSVSRMIKTKNKFLIAKIIFEQSNALINKLMLPHLYNK